MTSLDSSAYTYEAPVSAGLFARGQQIIPGGVNSPVRAFKGVGGTPRFVRAASGAFLEDVDGNRLIDFGAGLAVLNWRSSNAADNLAVPRT